MEYDKIELLSLLSVSHGTYLAPSRGYSSGSKVLDLQRGQLLSPSPATHLFKHYKNTLELQSKKFDVMVTLCASFFKHVFMRADHIDNTY